MGQNCSDPTYQSLSASFYFLFFLSASFQKIKIVPNNLPASQNKSQKYLQEF